MLTAVEKSACRNIRDTASASLLVESASSATFLPDQKALVIAAALAVTRWLIPCFEAHSQAKESFSSPSRSLVVRISSTLVDLTQISVLESKSEVIVVLVQRGTCLHQSHVS